MGKGAIEDGAVSPFHNYEGKTSSKVDYVYKRCYIDNQGNFIDPRTFWDELLKYYRPGEALKVSEGDRRMMVPVPVKVRRAIKLEKAQQARLAQIHWMEARYLEAEGKRRKRAARKRIHELEAQYLELRREHDNL